MFKGKTKRCLAGIEVPKTANVSVAFQVKGSYRAEDMIFFLEKWLDTWSLTRDQTNDWRLLLLDSYRAHFDPRIQECAWLRGYVILFHYGNTTGVTQVNDIALHAAFKRIYVQFEVEDFVERALVDPGDISRSKQQVFHGLRARTHTHRTHVYRHGLGLEVQLYFWLRPRFRRYSLPWASVWALAAASASSIQLILPLRGVRRRGGHVVHTGP